MKASVIKNPRVVAKKSPTNSNSRHAKKPTESPVAARKPRKFKSLIGSGKGEVIILGDLTEPTIPWTW